MKCKVCRKWFVPTVDRVYQAREEIGGALAALSSVPRTYDVIDCPRCGCQHPLKVRMPKVKEGDANE